MTEWIRTHFSRRLVRCRWRQSFSAQAVPGNEYRILSWLCLEKNKKKWFECDKPVRCCQLRRCLWLQHTNDIRASFLCRIHDCRWISWSFRYRDSNSTRYSNSPEFVCTEHVHPSQYQCRSHEPTINAQISIVTNVEKKNVCEAAAATSNVLVSSVTAWNIYLHCESNRKALIVDGLLLACSLGQNAPIIVERTAVWCRCWNPIRLETERNTNLYDALSGGDVLRNFNNVHFLFERGWVVIDIFAN